MGKVGQKRKEPDNSGFSLIELIVVIAVMAIAASGMIYGMYLLRSGDAKKAVRTVAGQISAHRSNTLARAGKWQLELVQSDGRYELYSFQNGECQEQEKLGNRIKVYYSDSETASAAESLLKDDERLVITFVQSSGKVADVRLVNGGEAGKPVAADTGVSLKGSGYLALRVSGRSDGSGESFKLYYETGKVVMD